MTFLRSTMIAFLSTASKQRNHITNHQSQILHKTCSSFNPVAHKAYSFSSTRLFASGPSTQYILYYDYIPDVLEKRGPHRELHLSLAQGLADEGKCLSGGPTTPMDASVPDGAIFVFTNEESARWFVQEDPYVKNGIVTDWTLKEWTVPIQA